MMQWISVQYEDGTTAQVKADVSRIRDRMLYCTDLRGNIVLCLVAEDDTRQRWKEVPIGTSNV